MTTKVARSVFAIFRVLSDLMNGAVHSRHTIAARAGVALVTADRWIDALLVVPGCRTWKNGKTTLIEWRAPVWRSPEAEEAPRPAKKTRGRR